jgi:diguanylate cyclase (GGDEF)-like protein
MSKKRTSPRRWQRLSLRTKTVIVTAVPMALIVLAVPLGFLAQRESVRVERDVEQAYRVRQRLAQTQQSLVDVGTGVAAYLLTNDEKLLDTSDAGLAATPHQMLALGALIAADTPQTLQRFARLQELVDTRVSLVRKTREFGAQTPAGTTPKDLIDRGTRVMEQIRTLIATMDATEAQRLDAARARLHDVERISLTLSAGLVPIAILLAILVAVRHTNTLVRGIRRIEENARRLERGEELLDPPPGDDELARLGRALDETATRLVQQEQELRELALVDHLTGLPNRRAFQALAEHELELAKRNSNVTALLFVDADGLKAVNDRAGHAVGDDMLCEVAAVLREEVRTADLVARIGGDEFVVMLSRDSALENNDVVERLEAAIARRNAQPNRPYILDFSIGVAVFDPSDPISVDELITRADAEMYQVKRAKRLARGQVEAAKTPVAAVWATPSTEG